MSIAKRLYLLMLVSLLSLLAVAGAGIFQIHKVFNAANFANENTVPSMLDLNDATLNGATARARVWQYMAADDPALREKIRGKIADNDKTAEAAFVHYEKENIADETDRRLFTEARKAYADFAELRRKVMAISDEGKREEARDLLMANQAVMEKLAAAFKEQLDYNIKLSKESADAARYNSLGNHHCDRGFCGRYRSDYSDGYITDPENRIFA